MPLVINSKWAGGIGSTFAAAVAAILFIFIALAILNRRYLFHLYERGEPVLTLIFLELTPLTRTVSVSASRFIMFKTLFYILLVVGGIWMFTTGAILFSMQALSTDSGQSQSVANGAIYMSAFAAVLVFNVAIIFPGLLMLQPIRLWKVLRAEKAAVTPRQRFRGQSTFTCCRYLSLTTPKLYILDPMIRSMRLAALSLPLFSHLHLLWFSLCLRLLFCCYFP